MHAAHDVRMKIQKVLMQGAPVSAVRASPQCGKARCRASAAAYRYLLCVTVSQFITISLSLIVGKPIGPIASTVPVQFLCLTCAKVWRSVKLKKAIHTPRQGDRHHAGSPYALRRPQALGHAHSRQCASRLHCIPEQGSPAQFIACSKLSVNIGKAVRR